MKKAYKVISTLNAMPISELQELADELVWFDEALAERLKNCIAVAQQDRDQAFLNQWEQEKQYEMASRMADDDAEYYGERI